MLLYEYIFKYLCDLCRIKRDTEVLKKEVEVRENLEMTATMTEEVDEIEKANTKIVNRRNQKAPMNIRNGVTLVVALMSSLPVLVRKH